MVVENCSAVLFDLDDTLLDHRGAAGDALRQWAPHAGLGLGGDELAMRWQQLEAHYYELYQRGVLTRTQQRRERLRELLWPKIITEVDADELFNVYWEFYSLAWRPFPDAECVVRRAREHGLHVGLLTNGDAKDQRRKVEATDLSRFGLPLFASSELPAAKPDSRAFQFACASMGVAPADCLMVGDSLINDIQGALSAGMPAVLVDRTGSPGAGSEEFGRVRSLHELRFR